MASDSRALTLKLLADTADFQKKLEAGSKDVESIGDRVTEFGKKAALAFAAAGAAVGAFAVSAVKAAAEDEAAQKQLANTIQATTDATAKQIAGVEQYIKQTSIAIGVTDDQLRPAFARLVRSTKDVEDAQKLLDENKNLKDKIEALKSLDEQLLPVTKIEVKDVKMENNEEMPKFIPGSLPFEGKDRYEKGKKAYAWGKVSQALAGNQKQLNGLAKIIQLRR